MKNKKYIFAILSCLFLLSVIISVYLIDDANNRSITITDESIPLSNGEVSAQFYILASNASPGNNLSSIQSSKNIGAGTIQQTKTIINNEESVGSLLCNIPDSSSYISSTEYISWVSIYKISGQYYVVGEVNERGYVSTYNTVSDLYLCDAPVDTTVNTLGYYTAGDGGAAEYTVSSTPGTFSISLSNGLYVNLKYSNSSVSIKQLGAKGDGTTNDAPVFQTALDHGIDKIIIPTGTYNLQNTELSLSKNISFSGSNQGSCILKNVNIVAPYGISLDNLTLDGGTNRTVSYQGWNRFPNSSVMILTTPATVSSISYSSCTFRNADYASIAWLNANNAPYYFSSDTVTECTFENIKRACILHSVNITTGIYTNNVFRNNGGDILDNDNGAIKVGDTTSNTVNEVGYCLISGNTFDTFYTGNDSSNAKHSGAFNFITVKAQTAEIKNNRFYNLLGYGEDREAIYTKCRYTTVSDNYIENGGMGEGYICCKNTSYSDCTTLIQNNTLVGTYGRGIVNYGGGTITNNNIQISNCKNAITVYTRDSETSPLNIVGNSINCGVGLYYLNGQLMTDYNSDYFIVVEQLKVPVSITGNTIVAAPVDGTVSSMIRVGGISNNVTVSDNNILSTIAGCAGIAFNASSAFEAVSSNVQIILNNNTITADGSAVLVNMSNSGLVSSRYYSFTNNTFNCTSGETRYGVIFSLSAGNNDTLHFESVQTEHSYQSNIVYATMANVDSDRPELINHSPK